MLQELKEIPVPAVPPDRLEPPALLVQKEIKAILVIKALLVHKDSKVIQV